MKLQTSLQLVAGLAAICLGAAARAQMASAADLNAGLLGQTYTGLEFDYVNRTNGISRTQHHYGFVSSLPLQEFRNVDGAVRYDYSRESAGGLLFHQHELAMAFTGYMPQGDAKLFVEGDVGAAWRRAGGGANDSSFVWRAVVGGEVPVAPRVVVTPYVSYKEAGHFDQHVWRFGGKIARRFDHDWSGSAGLAVDDHRNTIWSLALQRRF